MTDGSRWAGVALSGRAGSGKSSVAELLVDYLGLASFSFAAAVKSDLATLGCLKGMPGFREVAIAYGTTHKRAIDPDYWVTRARRDCQGSLAGRVIDDLRFANEARAAEADGLLLVRLDAHPSVRLRRLGLAIDDPFVYSTDESECGLEKWEFTLRFCSDIHTSREIADMIADHYISAGAA